METWAHGLDVADALGVTAAAHRPAAPRRAPRRAHAGLRLPRPRSNAAGRAVPRRADRAGRSTGSGAEDATQSVTGSALDFCLLRHPAAQPRRPRARGRRRRCRRWLDIAQAFAGPPGPAASRRVRANDPRLTRRTNQAGLICSGRRARVGTCCGSATARGSTATARRRCTRCSPAASSTCSPATTSPSSPC